MKYLKLFVIFFGICLSFYGGSLSSKITIADYSIREITINDYHELKDSGADFVLYIERPSCRYCAVVSSYVLTMKNPPLPVYYISLEPFWKCEDYETIKKELNVTYLPSFKYISDGKICYNLNNPLLSSYYDLDGPRRMELYKQMQEKVNAFINGAAGQAPIVDEIPILDDAVIAVPQKENSYD